MKSDLDIGNPEARQKARARESRAARLVPAGIGDNTNLVCRYLNLTHENFAVVMGRLCPLV